MKTKRNVYLKMKTLAEARSILEKAFPGFGQTGTETVPPPEAVGRVLAEPVFAGISAPNFHAAAMDGVAVKAERTFGASEARPKELIVDKDVFYLNTGHVMPDGTDAVIMVEHLNVIDAERVSIEAPVFPWQHVRKMGEDIVATELLFPRNHLVTPPCVGALIGGGIFSVPVRKRPKVMVMPTGSELEDWQTLKPEALKPGRVLDSNSYVLGKMTEECGGEYVRHEVLVDDPEAITRAVQEAVDGDFDIILTVGGSSAGSED